MEEQDSINSRFKGLLKIWSRIAPIMITEVDTKRELINDMLPAIQPCKVVSELISPKAFYYLLRENPEASFLMEVDILQKRKNYIEILEGAICSSPDRMKSWPVRYKSEKPFTFRGRIIICTALSRADIAVKKKFEYIRRDCAFI